MSVNNTTKLDDYNKYNAKQLWGSLVSLLRKNKLRTLYTACGEIRDVEILENKLVVYVFKDYLYIILSKSENLEKISFYFNQINDKIKIDFVYKEKENFAKYNLKKLRDYFGEELNTKN